MVKTIILVVLEKWRNSKLGKWR